MTCIATDGKSIAADGRRVSFDDLIESDRCQKLWPLADGRIMGVAGMPHLTARVIEWLDGGSDPAGKPKVRKDEWEALLLSADGRVEWIGTDLEPLPFDPPIAAIGSGARFALAAMDLGASPKEAVAAAARRCTTVGGRIVELRPGAAE